MPGAAPGSQPVHKYCLLSSFSFSLPRISCARFADQSWHQKVQLHSDTLRGGQEGRLTWQRAILCSPIIGVSQEHGTTPPSMLATQALRELARDWLLRVPHWPLKVTMQLQVGLGSRLCFPTQPSELIYQFSSLSQARPTLCNPMDCSTSGFPVYHQLSELTQTHVHPVSDAIQPSHPLLSLSPPSFSLSQHQGLFK